MSIESLEEIYLIARHRCRVGEHLHSGRCREAPLLRGRRDFNAFNRADLCSFGSWRGKRLAVRLPFDNPHGRFCLFNSGFESAKINKRSPEIESPDRLRANTRELIRLEKPVDWPVGFREGLGAHLHFEVSGWTEWTLLYLCNDAVENVRQPIAMGHERSVRVCKEVLRARWLTRVWCAMEIGIVEDDLDRIIGHWPPPS